MNDSHDDTGDRELLLTLKAPFRTLGVCFKDCGTQRVKLIGSLGVSMVRLNDEWIGMSFADPLDVGMDVGLRFEAPVSGDLNEADRVRWVPAPTDPRILKVSSKSITDIFRPYCIKPDRVSLDKLREEGRVYFSRLDRMTNTALGLLEPRLAPIIRALWSTLYRRISDRRELEEIGREAARLGAHGAKGDVQEISSLMIQVLELSFGTPLTENARLEKIGRIYDVFSWGGLHVEGSGSIVSSTTSPDGAAIFMFPEFAHLAIQMRVNEETWSELLPTLTRMPILYLKSHELVEGELTPRPFLQYRHPPSKEGIEDALVSHSNALREAQSGVSPDALDRQLTDLTAKAFVLGLK